MYKSVEKSRMFYLNVSLNFPSILYLSIKFIFISGYVWGYQHCRNAILIGKTDDNVVLDMESLLTGVKMMENNPPSVRSIMCGSGTPHRNMKPLRSDRTHMTGRGIFMGDHFPLRPDTQVTFMGCFLP